MLYDLLMNSLTRSLVSLWSVSFYFSLISCYCNLYYCLFGDYEVDWVGTILKRELFWILDEVEAELVFERIGTVIYVGDTKFTNFCGFTC